MEKKGMYVNVYKSFADCNGRVTREAGPNSDELGYTFDDPTNGNRIDISVTEIREMIKAIEEDTEEVFNATV